MKRCLIIRNPASRRQLTPVQVESGAGLLRAEGWDVTIAITERAGHATEVAREAAAQLVDLVIVNGGDGTINEVINGLAGSQVALGVLPGGTANVWAKEARIPRDPAKAIRVATTGRRERIDLGVANGRYFLLMAGVGLDAAIIPRVSARLKRRLGALAYILAGIITAIRTRPWDARILLDGDPVEGPVYWMLAGNTRNYGGLVHITHHARLQDAVLDAAWMRRGGWRLITDGFRMLFRRHDRSPNIRYRQAAEIIVETPGIPAHLDGEPCFETPLTITTAPACLTVVVPADLKSPLFTPRATGLGPGR